MKRLALLVSTLVFVSFLYVLIAHGYLQGVQLPVDHVDPVPDGVTMLLLGFGFIALATVGRTKLKR